MHTIALAGAATLALGLASAASAATISTYYFVSRIDHIANPQRPIGPPTDRDVVHGQFEFDADKSPSGQLRNLEVRYDPFDGGQNPDVLTSYVPCCDELNPVTQVSYSFKFDGTGHLSEWFYASSPRAIFLGQEFVVSKFGVSSFHDNEVVDVATETAKRVLGQKGYMPGTPGYAELFCGSWAGSPNQSCLESQEFASRAWATDYASTGAATALYSNLTDFLAGLDSARALAAVSPKPVSYADIAPIPAPAAFWMLAGALAGLGALRRRRK